MTLNPSWFLNATGQFLPIIGTSTTTTTSIVTFLTKSTTLDIAISVSTGTYTDGPAVAQGSAGTWYASGTVTLVSASGGPFVYVRLWDGTSVIASATTDPANTAFFTTVSLSGILVSPAGNLRLSARTTSVSQTIKFNGSGDALDSTITAMRIG